MSDSSDGIVSVNGRTLKAIVVQARLNAQLINVLGILAKNNNLGKDAEDFMSAFKAIIDHNNELVAAIDAAVDALGAK